MNKPVGLSKDDSLIIKGVAILAMMWHHCFLNESRFSQYDLTFFPFTQSQVINIASFLKICVGLFAFVSGYGLFCSLSKDGPSGVGSAKDMVRWYKTRYIRSFSDYWLIVLLCCVICQLLDGSTASTYFKDSMFTGMLNLVFSVIGVSSILDTPLLVGTWWYMSAALVYILLAPILYWVIRRFSSIACIGIAIVGARVAGGYPGSTHYLTFLPAFIMGMTCANAAFFDRVNKWSDDSPYKKAGLIAFLLATMVFFYKFNLSFSSSKFWDVKWGLFIPIYVLCIVMTVAKVPFLNSMLRFLGEWSAELFLMHTLIRSRYCSAFVYAEGHFALVMVRLIALTLLVALAFRLFKRVIRYDAAISRLLERVSSQ